MVVPYLISVMSVAAVVLVIPIMVMRYKPVKKVELLRPRDRRGQTLTVNRETDLGVECKRSGGFIYRFIKAGPSWVFNQGGRQITKFFGIEATAYTGIPKGDDIDRVSIAEFLKLTWGEKFYNAIPKKQKDAVEQDRVGLTLEIEKIDEEKFDLQSLSSADLDDEGDSLVLAKIAKGAVPSKKSQLWNFIIGAVLGAAVMLFISVKGLV